MVGVMFEMRRDNRKSETFCKASQSDCERDQISICYQKF